MKIAIIGRDSYNIKNNMLNSFEENFNTFNINTSKYTKVWYQTLLDQFQLLIDNTDEDIETLIAKILDIHLELEIKSKEIKIDRDSIYRKTKLEQYGIAV